MSWALFCQILILMLTAGLIIMFIIYAKQNAKDNSFLKRTTAAATALKEINAELARKKEGEQHDEQ